MVDYRFAYLFGTSLFGTSLFGLVWLYIFLRRPDLRKEQLFMSCLLILGGLTEPLFFDQYWHPYFLISIPGIYIGIESILLCFFYGGIASTLYEFIFNDILKKTSRENQKMRTLEILVAIFICATVFLFSQFIFKINIIYAACFGLLAGGITLIVFRKDLLLSAVLNGIIMTIISFIILIILTFVFPGIFYLWWRLDLLSGIRIFSIPFEEIIYHFSLGFSAGPLYEVWKGYSDLKKSLR